MCPNAINADNILNYDGVFKSGLKIQENSLQEEQLFDLNNQNAYLVGDMVKVDKSGLYKPFPNAGSSLLPTQLYPHGILDKPDEVYRDEEGKKCKVYKNDDGSYQIEKSNTLLGRLFGNTEIEQYDANGNLIAKQKDGVTYYYDEDGKLTKTSKGNFSSGTVVLYNEDGSVKAESESKMHPNGEGKTITTREYNENGSYTEKVQVINYSLSGTQTKATVQSFDKNGNPTSPAEEVDSQNYNLVEQNREEIQKIIQEIIEKLNTPSSSKPTDITLLQENIVGMLNEGFTQEEIIEKLSNSIN